MCNCACGVSTKSVRKPAVMYVFIWSTSLCKHVVMSMHGSSINVIRLIQSLYYNDHVHLIFVGCLGHAKKGSHKTVTAMLCSEDKET